MIRDVFVRREHLVNILPREFEFHDHDRHPAGRDGTSSTHHNKTIVRILLLVLLLSKTPLTQKPYHHHVPPNPSAMNSFTLLLLLNITLLTTAFPGGSDPDSYGSSDDASTSTSAAAALPQAYESPAPVTPPVSYMDGDFPPPPTAYEDAQRDTKWKGQPAGLYGDEEKEEGAVVKEGPVGYGAKEEAGYETKKQTEEEGPARYDSKEEELEIELSSSSEDEERGRETGDERSSSDSDEDVFGGSTFGEKITKKFGMF